jgi:hypothetical protein
MMSVGPGMNQSTFSESVYRTPSISGLPNAAYACCTSCTLLCSLIAPSRHRRFAALRCGVRAADNSS